jgi:hypothetical protein
LYDEERNTGQYWERLWNEDSDDLDQGADEDYQSGEERD